MLMSLPPNIMEEIISRTSQKHQAQRSEKVAQPTGVPTSATPQPLALAPAGTVQLPSTPPVQLALQTDAAEAKTPEDGVQQRRTRAKGTAEADPPSVASKSNSKRATTPKRAMQEMSHARHPHLSCLYGQACAMRCCSRYGSHHL